jgi:uncharacterized protein (DUF736 family)
MVIGKFSPTTEGGWFGVIRTLTIHAKVRFVPNDKRDNDRSPDFRIVSGHSELGVAWRRSITGADSRQHLGVKLDDPGLSAPIAAVLLQSTDGREAQLVWHRQQDGSLAPQT